MTDVQAALQPFRHPEARTPRQVYHDLCLDAAFALARRDNPSPLIDRVGDIRDPGLSGDVVAQWLYDAVPLSASAAPTVWRALWPALKANVEAFLGALERRAGASGLAAESGRVLERMILGRWWLRVAEGCTARLVYPADNLDALRVAIDACAAGSPSDVQLNQPRLVIRAQGRYVINFLARADRPRRLTVGCAIAHEPWVNLGLYRQVDLTPEWQSFEHTFDADAADDNARIHFDGGDSDISFEVSAIALRGLSEGRFIEPAVPAMGREPSAPAVGGEPSPADGPDPVVGVGEVQFGSLRRVSPISTDFGFDRGRPVDRYYIESFLASHAADIQGRVLEVGDNSYTVRFGGGRVTTSDVLHVAEGKPGVTIVADLTAADHVPSDTFDCVILTQTLQFIYDFRAALRTVVRILRPGGVLLATFPGVSRMYDGDLPSSWYWSFTSVSARRFFGELLPEQHVSMETFGNVLACISFLHGLAAEELSPEELNQRLIGYEVLIGVRATKPTPAEARSVERAGALAPRHGGARLNPAREGG